jgi:hypothetical protein
LVSTFQGIKTGANDIFILKVIDDMGALCRVENGIGDTAVIEAELLRPVVFGSDIQRYEIVSAGRRILYPYFKDAPIAESTLRQKYPRTYGYLHSLRDALEARSSIGRAKKKWYELAWERDESWLRNPKLLSRELATRCTFALDATGSYFLVGGIALIPADVDWLFPLLGYLNSKFADWYLRATMPAFQSAFYKLESRQISDLPVPDELLQDSSIGRTVGDLAKLVLRAKALAEPTDDLERKIDDALAESLDLRVRELD